MARSSHAKALFYHQDTLNKHATLAHNRSHTAKGREIIDVMLNNFELDGLEHIGRLRNIAFYHHEAMNVSGQGNRCTRTARTNMLTSM